VGILGGVFLVIGIVFALGGVADGLHGEPKKGQLSAIIGYLFLLGGAILLTIALSPQN
jgi:hypothetical protein